MSGQLIRTPAQIAAEQQLFFDMRHVSRAFEQLGGEAVRRFAEEQYDHGWHLRRKHPRRVKFVGDPAHGRILLVDAQEMNGQDAQRKRAGLRIGKPGRPVVTSCLILSMLGCRGKVRRLLAIEFEQTAR